MPAAAQNEARRAVMPEADRGRRLSLRYLNLFRLILAGLFLVAGRELGLGAESPRIYYLTASGYLLAVLALGFPDAQRRLGFDRTVALQVVIDMLALALIMWVSGGYRSGMPALMMVMLAGAGLIVQGRMVLFAAAIATIAVLIENTWRYVGCRSGSSARASSPSRSSPACLRCAPAPMPRWLPSAGWRSPSSRRSVNTSSATCRMA